MYKYFLSCVLADEKIEREVSLEEFCRAERAAGFYPKRSGDNTHHVSSATGGFSSSSGISGRVKYYLEEK